MIRKLVLLLSSAFALTSAALAGDHRIEFTPFIGYTFSEGVSINGVETVDGNIIDRISPKSAFSYGRASAAQSDPLSRTQERRGSDAAQSAHSRG